MSQGLYVAGEAWSAPDVEVPVWLLRRADDALAEAIWLLQSAQQTPWQSVAADAMRAELYAAIQVLRTIADEIADARDAVSGVRAAMTDWQCVA